MNSIPTYLDVLEALKNDDEEHLNESRPPRQTPKQRLQNGLKASVTRELMSEDSPVANQIKMIFKAFDKLLKSHAREAKIPIAGMNVDKITIKRKS